MQLLQQAAVHDVKVRVLVPMGNKTKEIQERLKRLGIDFRDNNKLLRAKVTTLVGDSTLCLTLELKADTRKTSEEAIGLATYSNSESTVLAYVSIFEMMWMESEPRYHGRNRKERRQEYREQKCPTMYNSTTNSKGTESGPKLSY